MRRLPILPLLGLRHTRLRFNINGTEPLLMGMHESFLKEITKARKTPQNKS